MRSTKVVTNSDPMAFLLSHQIINGKYASWIVILQEFDLEFVTPKSKKGLALAELISKLPTGTQDPPVNDDFPDELLVFMFTNTHWFANIENYLAIRTLTQYL